MTKESLLQILKTERLGMSGSVVTVSEDREATIFIATPGETIQVTKVVTMELFDSQVCLETGKNDRFWFAYEQVIGVRLLPAKVAKDRAAGFSK
jgi:hypothetical protein